MSDHGAGGAWRRQGGVLGTLAAALPAPLAVGAQRGWLGLGNIPGADRLSTSILAKANRTELALEPGWVKFSTYFKIGGGLIDSAFAIDAAARGD